MVTIDRNLFSVRVRGRQTFTRKGCTCTGDGTHSFMRAATFSQWGKRFAQRGLKKAVARRHTETSHRDTRRTATAKSLWKRLSRLTFLCVSLCDVSVCLRATAFTARCERISIRRRLG